MSPNKLKHPISRADRLRLNEKKKKLQDSTKADNLRRKLIKEEFKEQETRDELEHFFTQDRDLDRG